MRNYDVQTKQEREGFWAEQQLELLRFGEYPCTKFFFFPMPRGLVLCKRSGRNLFECKIIGSDISSSAVRFPKNTAALANHDLLNQLTPVLSTGRQTELPSVVLLVYSLPTALHITHISSNCRPTSATRQSLEMLEMPEAR